MALLSLRRGTLLTAAAVACCGGARAPALSHPRPTPAASSAVVGAPSASSPSPAAAPPQAPSASAVALPPAPTATSAVATTKTDDAWALCHRAYKAAADGTSSAHANAYANLRIAPPERGQHQRDVSKDVASLAKGCEKQTKMTLVGKTLTGKQADQDRPESFALDARANHCYRVYAQAAESIRDLDLAVKDSAGVVVGEDSTDDSSPVVLDNGAVCFSKDDKASIVVSVGMGSGAYAVQIWGD